MISTSTSIMDRKKPKVNAWTEWGTLEEVVVGRVENSCFYIDEQNMKQFEWNMPVGYQPKELIAEANDQLESLIELLEGESIQVNRPNYAKAIFSTVGERNGYTRENFIIKNPITVRRPEIFDFNQTIKGPNWEVSTMRNGANPRDVLATIGNTILEATMSSRQRFYEYLPYRKLIREYWHSDSRILWKTAPKPSMNDEIYDREFIQCKNKIKWQHEKVTFRLKEEEPIFDAAEMICCGKDIFIQHSMTANQPGIEWLKREFRGTIRVHDLHFLDALAPHHIDTSFLPLRPPRGLYGTEGLALYNPDWKPLIAEMELWQDNNWHLVAAPHPVRKKREHSLCSAWLSMNLLSLSSDCVVIEEEEITTYDFLTDLGFDVITCKFDALSEFGGGIHCATWDVRRDDQCIDYFPILILGYIHLRTIFGWHSYNS